MDRVRRLVVCLCAVAAGFLLAPLRAAPGGLAAAEAERALRGVPAWFEPNQGLFPPAVRYIARGVGYTLSIEESGAAVHLEDGSSNASLRLSLAGGLARPAIEAVGLRPGRTNYLLGADRSRWKSNVPQYARVRYRGVYPGIDLVFRGAGRYLEYDFVVSPGADPSRIQVRFQGAGQVRVDESGALLLSLGGRQILQPPPVLYQDTAGGRVPVEGGYLVASNGNVGFRIGPYDRTRPLVIDPVLVYAGYFGGNAFDVVTGVATDRDGNVWLTGSTRSPLQLPGQNEPLAGSLVGSQDAFLAKLSVPPGGTPTLLAWTYLGGSDQEWGGRVWVDSAGKVYATGATVSSNFPTTGNAVSNQLGGKKNETSVYNQDGFVVKIDPSASGKDSLLFGSYLGGEETDLLNHLAVDAEGMIYVAGYTMSVDVLPLVETTLQPSNRGGYDAFLYKIDPSAPAGSALVFNTYFGGRSTDVATGVGFDASGAVYLSGYTFSDDLPIAGDCYQCVLQGSAKAFLVKLDLTKTGLDTLVYATYFGGSSLDLAQAMAVDPEGGIWLTGYTLSTDFPVTLDAYQSTPPGGGTDVFLTRLDLRKPAAEMVSYSTYFGGSGTDIAYGLALLGARQVAITGYTMSNDLPLMSPPPGGVSRSLMADAFVAAFDTSVPGVGALLFSSYFGGSNQDVGAGVAAGPGGVFYAAGYTYSAGLPVTDGSRKPSPAGSSSGFLLRMDRQPGEPVPQQSSPGEFSRNPDSQRETLPLELNRGRVPPSRDREGAVVNPRTKPRP
ncbi:MAG: hypothetical protein IT159_11865 [Bryobacterales bacterium]|nr:hypothetical protein [Bryobacterales bacterium]